MTLIIGIINFPLVFSLINYFVFTMHKTKTEHRIPSRFQILNRKGEITIYLTYENHKYLEWIKTLHYFLRGFVRLHME